MEEVDRKGTADLIRYDRAGYEEINGVPIGTVAKYLQPERNLWIRCQSSLDREVLDHIAGPAGLDELDVNTIMIQARAEPKLLQFDRSMFLTWGFLKREGSKPVEIKVHILLGEGFLMSFEDGISSLDEILDLFRKGTRIRKMPVSYLLYAILDSTIDEFFRYSKGIGDRLGELQGEIETKSEEVLDEALALRGELGTLWSTVWPLKDITGALFQRQSAVVPESMRGYFGDENDRIAGLMTSVEGSRQVAPQVISLYENHLSNELNKVVRILTVITVVFTPIAVITSWFGMNFLFMPSLQHELGYPAVIVVTAAIGLGLTAYFWRKGWISV